MDLDGVAFDLAAEGAETVFELVLGQDGVRMLQQGLEKRPFPRSDNAALLVHRSKRRLQPEFGKIDA